MNLAQLKSELQNDLAGLGYATPLEAGNLTTVAALANGPGGEVYLTSVSKGQFAFGLLPLLANLAKTDAATQSRWDRVLQPLLALDSIDLTDTNVRAVLGAAVKESLLSRKQLAALTTKLGSRAEVLFGVGTVVTFQDCAEALRS